VNIDTSPKTGQEKLGRDFHPVDPGYGNVFGTGQLVSQVYHAPGHHAGNRERHPAVRLVVNERAGPDHVGRGAAVDDRAPRPSRAADPPRGP